MDKADKLHDEGRRLYLRYMKASISRGWRNRLKVALDVQDWLIRVADFLRAESKALHRPETDEAGGLRPDGLRPDGMHRARLMRLAVLADRMQSALK